MIPIHDRYQSTLRAHVCGKTWSLSLPEKSEFRKMLFALCRTLKARLVNGRKASCNIKLEYLIDSWMVSVRCIELARCLLVRFPGLESLGVRRVSIIVGRLLRSSVSRGCNPMTMARILHHHICLPHLLPFHIILLLPLRSPCLLPDHLPRHHHTLHSIGWMLHLSHLQSS